LASCPKSWIVPIPDTAQMAHMLENIRASDIKFTTNELQQFNNELNAVKIAGERLPAGVLAFSDVEAPIKTK